MSRKKRAKRVANQAAAKARRATRGDRAFKYIMVALIVASLSFIGYLAISGNSQRARLSAVAPTSKRIRKAKTLDDLLNMSLEELKDVDIAEMNLLCAVGLPGSENLDVDRCLSRLDNFVELVRFDTERHAYRVTDPHYAEHYKHSMAWFKAEMLAQTLQEECGVVYNMDRVRNVSFLNSKDQFIHGMIDDKNGGTCVSMPVIYIAVGRRLGYPLKLVPAKAHLFTRWEDEHDRFNVDVSTDSGIGSHTDEEYMVWPTKMTEAELAAGIYLKSMSPAEELACFLAARGHCLFDSGRTNEAVDAYTAAARFAPSEPAYRAWAREASDRLYGRPPPPQYYARPILPSDDPSMQDGVPGRAFGEPGAWANSNGSQFPNQPAMRPRSGMPQQQPPYPSQPAQSPPPNPSH